MMRMEVRSAHLPWWVVPILLLAALALIPFALVLALAVAGMAIGVSVVRFLLTGPQNRHEESQTFRTQDSRTHLPPSQVIDADYEVKEEK